MSKKKRRIIKASELDSTTPPDTRTIADTPSFNPTLYFKGMLKFQIDTLFKEYVNEAEHQDGDAYWANFGNPKEALADFLLYMQNSLEIPAKEEAPPKSPEEQLYTINYSDSDGNHSKVDIEGPTSAHARTAFISKYGNIYTINEVVPKVQAVNSRFAVNYQLSDGSVPPAWIVDAPTSKHAERLFARSGIPHTKITRVVAVDANDVPL